MPQFPLHILETPQEIAHVEELQRLVWPGSETEVVPAHMLQSIVSNGGLIIGAFDGEQLVGFVFGFPGWHAAQDGLRPKHCSHMAGVHPDFRNAGLGFALKRAQWQMVRSQGLDHITWTYDPLLSRNANLNMVKLGAVCSTYIPNYYGDMRDELNAGLPSDRFQVDWWLNSKRVNRRLSGHRRRRLSLSHYTESGVQIIAPSTPAPSDPLLLLEIPSDFLALKAADPALALEWRLRTREIFTDLFARGYLITDFIYQTGSQPRGFYMLSHGESRM